MSIIVEDVENGIAFLPGLFKFGVEDIFSQAVLMLTKEELIIFNDSAPDSVDGADWSYNAKERISFENIELVTNELIITKRPLAVSTNKIIINLKKDESEDLEEEKKPLNYFYYTDDNKVAANLMAGLKRCGVKINTIENKLTY